MVFKTKKYIIFYDQDYIFYNDNTKILFILT